MSGANFFSGMFQPVVLNSNGQITVADGYKAKFYAAGTDIPKTIYTDSELLVPYASPANIAFLDDTGKALIYLGIGGYKLVLTDPNDVPVPGYTIDNIVGGGTTFGTGFVNSFADLVNVNTSIFPYTYIGGYYEPGDGGQGMFYNAVSASAADGGYIQDSNFDPTKKWFRIPDEDGDVRAASFGFIGSGDKTNNLLAANSYAASIGARIRICKDNSDTGRFISSVALTGPGIVFEAGSTLTKATGSFTLSIAGIVEAGEGNLFSSWGTSVTLTNPEQVSRPDWFGASTDSGSEAGNATAFAAWKAAGAGYFIVPPGQWPHTGVFTPSTTVTTEFQGEILDGAGPTISIPIGVYYPNGSKINAADITARRDVLIQGSTTVADFYASTIEATGNITSDMAIIADGQVRGQNVDADLDITAGDSITAGTTITAGGAITAGSFVQSKAGTGSQDFFASGSAAPVAGTGNPALPANSITTDGGHIKIIFSGTTTAANPVITVTVGGQTVFAESAINNVTASPYTYHGEVVVIRTGATTSFSTGFVCSDSTGVGTINSASDSRAAAITWANSNTITQSAGGTNVKTMTLFHIYPVTGT